MKTDSYGVRLDFDLVAKHDGKLDFTTFFSMIDKTVSEWAKAEGVLAATPTVTWTKKSEQQE